MTINRCPGRLVWVEANTPMCDRAQQFYRDMFLWKIEPIHLPTFGILPALSTNDVSFGNIFMAMGLFAQSRWVLFTSGDLDDIAERAPKLGGKVTTPRREYPGWCSNGSVADPNGTDFNIIELEGGDSPDPVPSGAPATFELWTPRIEAVKDFYAGLFDGELTKTDRGYCVQIDGRPRFHLADAGDDHPPVWVPYFKSGNVGADERRAVTFGAIPRFSKQPLGDHGLSSLFVDPVGSFFGLLTES